LSVTCGRSVVFSTNKTDRHDIAKILLKVALNTITLTLIFQNLNNCLLFRYIRCLMISIHVTSFIQGTYDFGDHSSDYGCNSCHRYNKFHTPNVLHWIFVAQMDWYTHACKTKISYTNRHDTTLFACNMFKRRPFIYIVFVLSMIKLSIVCKYFQLTRI
jgi:hypothetical protein